jgi:hypothetical protein
MESQIKLSLNTFLAQSPDSPRFVAWRVVLKNVLSATPELCAMPHCEEFFGIARSQNNNLSAFVKSVKATV